MRQYPDLLKKIRAQQAQDVDQAGKSAAPAEAQLPNEEIPTQLTAIEAL